MTVTVEAKGTDILDALDLTAESMQDNPQQNAVKVFESLIKEVEYTYEDAAA
jgi:hypothetical protein